MGFTKLSCLAGAVTVCLAIASCGTETAPETVIKPLEVVVPRPEIYADFTLTADLSGLNDDQRKMIGLLIDASQIMDDLYWRQSYGNHHAGRVGAP